MVLSGGRDAGEVKSADGNLLLKTSLPRGLGGKGEVGLVCQYPGLLQLD